jgi:hypothetical protein
MVLTVSAVLALVGLFMITRLLSRLSAKSAQLGCMSEHWLAEQRQSHNQ